MAFIKLRSSIHEGENSYVVINPWDISSIAPRNEGGSFVTTKKGMAFKVDELVEEVEEMAYAVMAAKNKKYED